MATFALPSTDRVCAGLVFGDNLILAFKSGQLKWFSWSDLVPLQTVAGTADGLVQPAPAVVGSLTLPTQPNAPTAVLHPATYLNKIVVTDSGGQWHVVNINTRKVLYSAALPRGGGVAGGSPAILCATQSPAVDVLAFGCADGSVVVHNIKLDKAVVRFAHAAEEGANAPKGSSVAAAASSGSAAAVTAVSFCTARGAQVPLLLSATDRGTVALWDLKTRSLFHVDLGAHSQRITSAHFIAAQPVYVTTGRDNAVSVWLLDQGDGRPRKLRGRAGHAGTITAAAYFGGDTVASLADGADARVAEMITAGSEREVRVTHTALAHQCRELSQGNIEKRARDLGLAKTSEKLRLPPVIALATCERYVGDWANVVSAHEKSRSVYAWNWQRKALDAYVLPLPDVDPVVIGANTRRPNYATAVAISACGHYALVGGSLGTVSRYALQNGASHGEYPRAAAAHGGQAATKGRKRRRGTMLGAPLPAPDRDIGKGKGAGLAHIPGSVTAALRSVFGADSELSGSGFGDAAGAAAAREEKVKVDAAPESMLLSAGAAAAVRSTSSLPKQGGVSVGRVAHTGAVRGIAVDERNSVVVTAGADGALLWWSLKKHKMLAQVQLGAPATMVATHRSAGLVAVALDDKRVAVYDLASRRRVRLLTGHVGIVQSIAFSPDGRWVVSADMKGDVRVWDMPTGRCIDWLRFAAPATTVSLSPTGEFLATTHADTLGVSLWLNRTYYGWVPADKVPTSPVEMDVPPVVQEGAGGLEDHAGSDAQEDKDGEEQEEDADAVPAGAAGTLVLSGAPPSHWVNLLHLDTIAERNKPQEPVQDKEAAPFFLPTVQGLAPAFAEEGATGTAPGQGGSRILNSLGGDKSAEDASEKAAQKEFLRPLTTETARCASAAHAGLLEVGVLSVGAKRAHTSAAPATGDDESDDEGAAAAAALPSKVLRAFHVLEAHLKAAPPSVVDAELRTLCIGPDDHQGKRLLAGLFAFYTWQLRRLSHYELAQAQLAVLLQEYASLLSDTVASVEGRSPPPAKAARGAMAKVKSASEHVLVHSLRDLLIIQQRASARVESLMHESMCLVKYLSNLQ